MHGEPGPRERVSGPLPAAAGSGGRPDSTAMAIIRAAIRQSPYDEHVEPSSKSEPGSSMDFGTHSTLNRFSARRWIRASGSRRKDARFLSSTARGTPGVSNGTTTVGVGH